MACGLTLLADQVAKKEIHLPTSKLLLSPSPGNHQKIGSFPGRLTVSPDGRYAVVLEMGYGTLESNVHQGIAVLDLETNQVAEFPDDRLPRRARQSYFLGLAFSTDGKHLYASMASITDPEGKKPGSIGNGIAVYAFDRGKVTPERFISIAPQKLASGKKAGRISKEAPAGTAVPYPAGLAVVNSGGGEADRILVADNVSDDALLIDSASGKVLHRFDLSTHRDVPAEFPYTVVASRDGRRAWCSLWNTSQVAELDLESGAVTRRIELRAPKSETAPGSHPSEMLLGADEKWLFVALSNTDEVAVVGTSSGRAAFLSTKLPGQEFFGAYPQGLALSSDSKRLFVANASLDAVAVLDISHMGETSARPQSGSPLGFIPTEWYPTAVAVRGDELLVASAKSEGTGPNSMQVSAEEFAYRGYRPYIATLLHGSVARIKLGDAEQNLAALSGEVLRSNLMAEKQAFEIFPAGHNPIKHVIYIIKENRTFDQILGDLGVGDGDPSLTMYGADITPNEHKLARQFGVLDNFYDSGEVSGDGHVWSTAAITSDYTEKTWQIGYRSAERTYDYEGEVGDEYPLLKGQPDVNEPATGYLWTNLATHGLTYRHYGEYISTEWCDQPQGWQSPAEGTPQAEGLECKSQFIAKGAHLQSNVGDPPGGESPWPWKIPIIARNVPTKPELRDHFDPRFPDFRLEYPDQLRADEFLREFKQWSLQTKMTTSERAWAAQRDEEGQSVAARPDRMPAFITLRLGNDHTSGTRPGRATPSAAVADNDLALGRVVDAVSHSQYWENTAIFVLEDDAQDGSDHVDAHRSIAFVISKYSPGSSDKPFVDHEFYTTVNLIHTMEALLGLPPMNNNDAHAPVMTPLFHGPGTQPAYRADYRNRDNGLLYRVNTERSPGARESSKMDFSHADRADAALLNQILWRDRMGAKPMPLAKHAVIPAAKVKEDDD
ncbi:MAG TPA: bifunctional YncE family protein/alkaline phosphatase family protein [Terriglobales bacterium]|nr:bifunctional YncE family protein/alkaline phosphatase family protein [Terriglobales bacterium]